MFEFLSFELIVHDSAGGGGFQGCYLDNHRNTWRCARAVRKRPHTITPSQAAACPQRSRKSDGTDNGGVSAQRACAQRQQ